MYTLKLHNPAIVFDRIPRKSQETLMSVSGSVSASAQQELLTENLDTLELPKNIVAKIAKSAVRFELVSPP